MRRKVLAQSDSHPVARQIASVEDDGVSGCLCLAKVGKTKRGLGFVWIYNRCQTPTYDEAVELCKYDHSPAWRGCAGADAQCEEPEKSVWTFLWSDDGEALVLAQDGRLVAYLDGQGENYCRNLIAEFQWCSPWSDAVYREVVAAIRPPAAFDRKADRLTAKAIKSGKCRLEFPPRKLEANPLRFGRAKHNVKIALADHLKHPIWVSAHDDRHDEEWYKPIVSTTDVGDKVIEFDVPIITVKLEGTDLVGTAYYWADQDRVSFPAFWVGRKWQQLSDLPKVKYPAILVSLPSIQGHNDVRFRLKKRGDDYGLRVS